MTARVLARDGRAGVDDAFAALPRLARGDDPRWIPEDPAALARAFSPANPWFAVGRAATLCVPGRARLAVFHDPCCRVEGAPTAFFGHWAHRGAPDATGALLAAAGEWARAAGATRLVGPVDFTTHGRYRVRLHAEPDALPFPGEPDDPADAPAVLAACGLVPVRHYVTQLGVPGRDAVAGRAAARRALLDAGYAIAPLDADGWLALLPEVYAAADAMFGANLAYTPLPEAAFVAAMGEPVARRLCPHTSLVARAPDGSLAGFVLVQPHWGALLVQGAPGGPVPAAALSYAEHAPRLAALGVRTAVARTVGVAPAHRRRGLMAALGATALERGRGRYDRWMAALVRDDNPSRRFGAAHAAAERRYALYARSLVED